MLRASLVTVSLLSAALSVVAQAPRFPELRAYESCSFPDGLTVTDVQSMPADVKSRPAQSHGKAVVVPLLAGRRITFAYPGKEPFASAKVELLPEADFAANRKLLLDDFDDIVASDKTVSRNF